MQQSRPDGEPSYDVGPINHHVLHEQIYDALKRHMMMGRFTPGQRLPLRKLAQSLGTSLMPVRDALQRLESVGVVVSSPTRTMIVPEPTAKEQRDLVHIRSLLEADAAAKAALNRTEAELAQIAGHCDSIRKSAETDDLDLFLEANYNFHMAIAVASRISFITTILEPLWLRMGPLVRNYMPNHDHFLRAIANHERILEALAARDPEKAGSGIIHDVIESNRFDA
ncbi:GntR family transcriptional regulator [Paracoccus sp. 22332]|uniref:GntR family transcriptional regulator n=1 Tax=Paracoccus sp. 22332 TaxID=3453913 RepID=UPI003F87DC1B